jgi:hypothetical protein
MNDGDEAQRGAVKVARVELGAKSACIAHRICVWHVCYQSGQRPRHFIEDTGVCALPQPPWIGACAAIGCLRLENEGQTWLTGPVARLQGVWRMVECMRL